mmetsp:Transcript_89263/g.255569  ORF Transcript_89263/g.255569 Transcript_89263/m.255569 type:complete len:309 (+) Transcript_89263:534-1460(+)
MIPRIPLEVASGLEVARLIGVLQAEDIQRLIDPPSGLRDAELLSPEAGAVSTAAVSFAGGRLLQLFQGDASRLLVAPSAIPRTSRVLTTTIEREGIPDSSRSWSVARRERVLVDEVVAPEHITELVEMRLAIAVASALIVGKASACALTLIVRPPCSKVHALTEQWRGGFGADSVTMDHRNVKLPRTANSVCVLRHDLIHEVPDHSVHVRGVDLAERVVGLHTGRRPVHVEIEQWSIRVRRSWVTGALPTTFAMLRGIEVPALIIGVAVTTPKHDTATSRLWLRWHQAKTSVGRDDLAGLVVSPMLAG